MAALRTSLSKDHTGVSNPTMVGHASYFLESFAQSVLLMALTCFFFKTPHSPSQSHFPSPNSRCHRPPHLDPIPTRTLPSRRPTCNPSATQTRMPRPTPHPPAVWTSSTAWALLKPQSTTPPPPLTWTLPHHLCKRSTQRSTPSPALHTCTLLQCQLKNSLSRISKCMRRQPWQIASQAPPAAHAIASAAGMPTMSRRSPAIPLAWVRTLAPTPRPLRSK